MTRKRNRKFDNAKDDRGNEKQISEKDRNLELNDFHENTGTRTTTKKLSRVLAAASLVVVAILLQRRDDLLPYLYLQKPDLWNRVIPFKSFRLRPSMQPQDPRQVLIVGTMSAGTRTVVRNLQSLIGLEISHERSDASRFLTRDGTVSWIHGARFLPSPLLSSSSETVSSFCRRPTLGIGFHPRFYNYDVCDVTQPWSVCWARQCEHWWETEWGLGLRPPDGGMGKDRVATRFRTVLHQVRNPWKTMESLAVKFCSGTGPSRHFRADFTKVVDFLFPKTKAATPAVEIKTATPCIEAVARYVVGYTRAMLRARDAGYVNATYKIEETSVCRVAELAGFTNIDTVVYEPNVGKTRRRCQNPNYNIPMEAPPKFEVNRASSLRLTWSDLGTANGKDSLSQDIRELMLELGYDDPIAIPA